MQGDDDLVQLGDEFVLVGDFLLELEESGFVACSFCGRFGHGRQGSKAGPGPSRPTKLGFAVAR
jgi:hypothetical protein